MTERRSLTGARIETNDADYKRDACRGVAPSRERGSKHRRVGTHAPAQPVAPSRERGSKHLGLPMRRGDQASLPHGSADRNKLTRKQVTALRVAPSRERGSKPQHQQEMAASGWSLPHGSADRNMTPREVSLDQPSRSLTGARIETRHTAATVKICPVSLPHGSADRNSSVIQALAVARCRSLTGARIETPSRWPSIRRASSLPHGSADRNRDRLKLGSRRKGRSLTGARIETRPRTSATARRTGRSLTGARIETPARRRASPCGRVAPSRERGSKHRPLPDVIAIDAYGRSLTGARIETHPSRAFLDRCVNASLPHGSADRNTVAVAKHVTPTRSLSHGSADRNRRPTLRTRMGASRSLTGARIETPQEWCVGGKTLVAPSRERGSKLVPRSTCSRGRQDRSLTGARIETRPIGDPADSVAGRSLTGARIETARERAGAHGQGSLPHGSADRNRFLARVGFSRAGRSLTGARIET